MTVFALKLMAVLLMLTDHLGIVLYGHRAVSYEIYHWMRTLGRFAFPIYCFLLAEGFRHLRKNPKRLCGHLLLLLALAVFSGCWGSEGSASQSVTGISLCFASLRCCLQGPWDAFCTRITESPGSSWSLAAISIWSFSRSGKPGNGCWVLSS